MDRIAAFFDVDETLINLKSMFSFLEFMVHDKHRDPEQADKEFQELMTEFRDLGETHPRSEVNRLYYEQFKGVRQLEFVHLADRWFQHVETDTSFYIQSTLERLRHHQSLGHEVVFVSGACNELLEPLANRLKVSHLLGVQLEVSGGCFTGKLRPPQTIGSGKAEAVTAFMTEKGIDAPGSYAYGDHYSDRHMLDCVGHPVVLKGDQALEDWAKARPHTLLNPLSTQGAAL